MKEIKYMSKFEEKTFYIIDYHDFERIVKEVYEQEYEVVADMEWNNDSEYSFSTESAMPKYDEKDIKEFMETGESSYLAGTLIVDLAKRGLIPQGNILISVYW